MKAVHTDKDEHVPPLHERGASEGKPTPLLPGQPIHPNQWYWYKGEPIYITEVQGVLTARGYNFDAKNEWRLPVAELERIELDVISKKE